MFGSILDSITDSVEDFIDNPVGYVVETAVSPITDTLEVLEGLGEGEIRTLAIARLGADVVGGMVLSEVVEALLEG